MEDWRNYRVIPVIRKLFVVPLAENDHGKSLIIRQVVRIARGEHRGQKRGEHALMLSSGQIVSAIVFPASLSEQQHREPGLTVESALAGVDPHWWTYDLIIFPCHVDPSDVRRMRMLAHAFGFDAIVANITRNEGVRPSADLQTCLAQNWDERWWIRNETIARFGIENAERGHSTLSRRANARIGMLAAHLWSRIGRAMLS